MQVAQFYKKVHEELKSLASEEVKRIAQTFNKTPVKMLGVRTPKVRELVWTYSKELKNESKDEIFILCEKLLLSGLEEEATVAISLAEKRKKIFQEKDFDIFEQWLLKYIHGWGKCDDICTHIFSYFVYHFPITVKKIKKWRTSNNLWMRRASAVSYITTVGNCYGVKHNLSDIFETAEILMDDPEDLVQKGYGWMLKAASVVEPKKVFDFVVAHESKMTRTAFRYSLEKMPEIWKKQALNKTRSRQLHHR